MLFDACSTLAADHAFVDGVIAVAINIGDGAIFEIDFNATATRAHIACGGFNLIPCFRRKGDNRLRGHDDLLSRREWIEAASIIVSTLKIQNHLYFMAWWTHRGMGPTV